MNTTEQNNIPVRNVFLSSKDCRKNSLCKKMTSNIQSRLTGRYISNGTPCDKRVVVAHIDLRNLTLDTYLRNTRKKSKGAALRQSRKADREEIVVSPFTRKTYIPDIVDINHSMPTRTGKPMREAYLKSIKELGGPAKKSVPWSLPDCPEHFDVWWGAFKSVPGYLQGKIQTDQRMVGYVDFRRVGNLAFYSLILGHGEYLKFGIMYKIHFEIMEWVLTSGLDHANGIETLMYAGFNQGGDGLMQWKKKVCFEPCYLAYGDV